MPNPPWLKSISPYVELYGGGGTSSIGVSRASSRVAGLFWSLEAASRAAGAAWLSAIWLDCSVSGGVSMVVESSQKNMKDAQTRFALSRAVGSRQ